ncbi:MAG: diaminopimelate decarboxylase [Lentisphaeria bacterium]|nr:diaminopimelate decarboxylase [Lentisphaeria bacterium]
MISNKVMLEAAEKFGTPLFLYDIDKIRECYNSLFKFIPYKGLKIHYALKANYNIAILKALRDIGCGLDTVSPGEVALALQLGFKKEDIIYTANNMTDAEFAEVAATGVVMNIGELSRLEKTARNYPGSRICLRFNPDVKDGDNEKTMTAGDLTKFGILLDDVEKVVEIVRKGDLHVVGLHEHTGSGLQKAESVYQSMKNLMNIVTKERFPELEFLDFGGGFKVPYMPDEKRIDYVVMGREIVSIFEDFCKKYGRDLKMYFEPGKYMVAEAGHLLVEVNTIKKNRSRIIAGCNSGFPQLIRPVMYGAYHHIVNLSNPDGELQKYDICGNICETGDRFAEERMMPEIREYDILEIQNAGAYCYSMGGVYNLRPMPSEAVYADGELKLVRKAQSNAELASEIIASAL